MTFLYKALPLYVNLIFGGLYIFAFTGTWAIINDLAKLEKVYHGTDYQAQIKTYLARIRFRRVASFLAGVVMIVLYFYERNMVIWIAILFGVLWFTTFSLASEARQFIKKIEGKN